MQRFSHRAFTLVEVMVTLAVIGIAASLGMATMSGALQAANQRDSAFRFTEDARHIRADNIRQGLYTIVTTAPTGSGTTVTFGGQRTGTASLTPCQVFMSAGAAPDVLVTKFYKDLDIKLSEGGAGSAPLTNICFTPGGQPFTNDLQNLIPVKMNIFQTGATGTPANQLVVDQNGAMDSTFDLQTKDGVASNSLYTSNDLGIFTPKP
ncbi:MAG TPA: type II secretion system protein, partial [Myxococcota bacterium]